MITYLQVETLRMVFKATLSGSISARKLKQFEKEVHFYSNIIPAVNQFQEAANIPEAERIDAFAQHFCSRLSLNSGKIVPFKVYEFNTNSTLKHIFNDQKL